MSQVASILLLFVNLISSGLVEFAINNCCESDREVNCCSPSTPIKSEKSQEYLRALGCCCDESASHFYYYTAKFQSYENHNEIKSLKTLTSINRLLEWKMAISFISDSNFNKRFLEFKTRKGPPPVFRIQYDVWLI